MLGDDRKKGHTHDRLESTMLRWSRQCVAWGARPVLLIALQPLPGGDFGVQLLSAIADKREALQLIRQVADLLAEQV